MAAYLIADQDSLAGTVIRLEDGDEWTIGRDPDVSSQVIEDPMVSRKHVMITLTDEGYLVENLSSVNAASIGGEPIEEPTLLKEGDILQIGNVSLRFTKEAPEVEEVVAAEEEEPEVFGEEAGLDTLSFMGDGESAWLLKVISGPNAGGEFGIQAGSTYVIGKDPMSCDIIFHDVSVSKRHAKISCSDDGTMTIEDLGSKNGTLVNARPLTEPKQLESQDMVVMGATSFLAMGRAEARETIVSAPAVTPIVEEEVEEEVTAKNWKDIVIPTRHLALGGLLALIILFGIGGSLSLVKSTTITMEKRDASKHIVKALKQFPEVQFSFNDSSGTLFLLGHVMSDVDHQEMMYLLRSLPYVTSIEDNVVVDEQVWESFNPLLARNPHWRSVTVSSVEPGDFVLRGYLEDSEQLGMLEDYVNINFPYLDKLTNEVVVEKTLGIQVQSLLISHNFGTVAFEITNGELVLAGRVEEGEERSFNRLVTELKKVDGIRMVKNYVVFAGKGTSRINLSSQYTVTGTTTMNDENAFVMINGKILGKGDDLDGMTVENVGEDAVFLEKDGIKYRINYNPQ